MIRLARRGKKNKPFYRVVVSEKARDLFGDALEIVGHYSPTSSNKELVLDSKRIQYWLSKGAKASPSVHNLLISGKVISAEKVKVSRTKKEKK